jgi:hypothetical protein
MGRRLLAGALLASGLACQPLDEHEAETPPDPLEVDTAALGLWSCSERTDTGYVRGAPFPIAVVTVDGKPVERDTANAYIVMQQAAARDGVTLAIVSGFRTHAEQQRLYGCYVNCNCNNCNLAARPGYSNHQSGHALDLDTGRRGALAWLDRNGARFGFSRTVPSENWHWEWWGGGPGGGPCGGCTPHCEGSRIIGADCGAGDCAAFGATCVDDALGVRCASVFCPARGEATVCVDDATIGACRDGAIRPGDCSAFGARCVDDALGARCVSVLCPALGSAALCLDEARLARCEDGAISSGDCSAFGARCVDDARGARCVSVFCPELGRTSACLDGTRIADCDDGAISGRDCPEGSACVDAEGGARCVSPECAAPGREGAVGCSELGWYRCGPDGVAERRACPKGSRCSVHPEPACQPEVACPPAGEASVCLDATTLGACRGGAAIGATPCPGGCVDGACMSGPGTLGSEPVATPPGGRPAVGEDGVVPSRDGAPGLAPLVRRRVEGGCATAPGAGPLALLAVLGLGLGRRRIGARSARLRRGGYYS